MAGLPKGFKRGLLVGGIAAVVARLVMNKDTRDSVTGKLMEGAGALPLLGSRLYGRFADQFMSDSYRAIAEEILAEARSGELLELGSGPGHLAQELAQRARDLQITAMDISGDMVQMTEARIHEAGLGSQVKVVHGDAMDIPFPSESFDYVVSMGALHGWMAPEIVLREIHRVLKPGGKVWIYDLRRETAQDDWDEVRRQVPLTSQPLFDMGVMNPWRSALDEEQIRSFVLKSPFASPAIAPVEAEMAYMRLPAFTRVVLEKRPTAPIYPPPPAEGTEGTGQQA